ncbi:Phosphatidylethanolamine N-methyltransferase [Roseomonas mucosa]|jgi:phosphatidylethanolamine/phosphatidyl-N-methylethanolamine N-methyltransferase|uniref:SAM-dependent methyltransferase n=1 Tax=Roseomonas mucosa TaxID=207340 RepID=A0A1S8D342_9PROT|nr:class I SAM-dependent methyltransferase [Roseomonas sp. FDAARGOS_362]AWV22144.1 Phosphatidylethanolamine N-methyltransferase [Roseomonas mucosa]MBS5903521.1 class I SAM-dependent methyltransferase [Acetobacteraceae bacterium]GAV34953.1 putative methyltransferase YcgJ [Roseomonas sp. TAS13]ONH82733.1 SAM-dependent methyltransferase [Roseomonas mucosa]
MSSAVDRSSVSRDHPRAALDASSVRDAYRRWAGVYDALFGGVSAFGRKRAVAAVNRLPGARVLEVGVGTGLALPLYRRDLRVTGIDLSREMLEKAAERVASERLPNVDGLLEMDAEAMAFQDGAFDMAVAMFTASVVPNARQLYAEMSRVVRPGGRLLFVNHFAAEAGPRWWVERAMAPLSRVLGWHPDFELSALLDRETAEIEAIEPCPPAGLFTLVQLRNGDTLRRALAA